MPTQKENASKGGEKRSKAIVIGLISAGLLAIGTGAYYFSGKEKLKGAGEFGELRDNTSVADVQEKQLPKYDIGKVAPILASTEGKTIESVEDFKLFMKEASLKSEEVHATTLPIPKVGLLFGLGSSSISAEGLQIIQEYAKIYLQTNKEAVILVEGYTCDLGSDNSNERLSKHRAEVVANVFLEKGIPTNKLAIKWYGEKNSLKFDKREDYRRVNVSIK